MNSKLTLDKQLNASRNSDDKLVAQLEKNLEKQLDLMRSFSIEAAMDMIEKNSEKVEHIRKNKILENPKFKSQKNNIVRLFKEISLIAAARKQALASEIIKLRKGKRSLSAYKNSDYSQHSNLL